MGSNRGEWCWSLDGETWTPVASREEAISAAEAEAGGELRAVIRVHSDILRRIRAEQKSRAAR
jgi:hypothetical protein